MIVRVLFSLLGVAFLVGGLAGILVAPNTVTSHLAVLTGIVALGFGRTFELLKSDA